MDGAMDIYLREINQTPLLTRSQERALARRVVKGDSKARDHMIRANVRLVVSIARNFTGRGVPIEDLIQYGSLGLMIAVEKFDPGRGVKFSTFSSHWIKNSIRTGIAASSRIVRVPMHARELVVQWHKMASVLGSRCGRLASRNEVAQELNLSAPKLRIVHDALRGEHGFPGVPWFDIAEPRAANPLEDSETLEVLLQGIDQLQERERMVIRLRFGLGGGEGKTLHEIGEVLNLTRERVRQIERDALEKLRKRLGQEVE